MIRTLPATQKPLVLRRFCSAYSKNRTKARAAKSEQNRDFMRDQARARAASFPPSISASVPALLLIPFQSNKRRGFRCSAIPSTFQISSQPTPAHTTPAHASLQASRQPSTWYFWIQYAPTSAKYICTSRSAVFSFGILLSYAKQV